MEIEQMGFNGEGFIAKSRPHADVGDRVERLIVHAGAGEINAIAGNQVVIAAQVDGGNRVAMAVAASAPWCASDAEDASQKPPRQADPACAQQRPNLAAGNGNAAHYHHGISLHYKVQVAAEPSQLFCGAFGLVAEMKVLSLMRSEEHTSELQSHSFIS